MNFQVISLPRCSSTWVANWLTDNDAICYHDPLNDRTTKELSEFNPEFNWGISCTSAWLAPKWLDSFDCPRIILMRDVSEINESLKRIGLPEVSEEMVSEFDQLDGKRINYQDIFDAQKAKEVWEYLRGTRFNATRHKELCNMNIQPEFRKLKPNLDAIINLIQEGE